MIVLSPEQIDDLADLTRYCEHLETEFVIIGAIAYQHSFPRESRQTLDIDIAVALDFPGFVEIEKLLATEGWTRTPDREHRWKSRRGTRMDLVPAGLALRRDGKITWPESQFTMSLIGFDHVFAEAAPVEISAQLSVKVIPARVLMLLKIVAFMDDQYRRAKDLSDIRAMLYRYLEDSDRVYSDQVFDANLVDVDLASAFLLGLDLRSLCTVDELGVVRGFLAAMSREDGPAWASFVQTALHPTRRSEQAARDELRAFAKGLDTLTGP